MMDDIQRCSADYYLTSTDKPAVEAGFWAELTSAVDAYRIDRVSHFLGAQLGIAIG